MAFLACISLAFYFFFIAHSTLLYFLAEESNGHPFPVQKIIFPIAPKGKMVAALALVSGLLFLFMAPRLYPRNADEWEKLWSVFRMFLAFVVFPMFFYFLYIVRRVRKKNYGAVQRWVFVPLHATRWELGLPAIVALFLNIVSILFK
jgi:hypothetical protein